MLGLPATASTVCPRLLLQAFDFWVRRLWIEGWDYRVQHRKKTCTWSACSDRPRLFEKFSYFLPSQALLVCENNKMGMLLTPFYTLLTSRYYVPLSTWYDSYVRTPYLEYLGKVPKMSGKTVLLIYCDCACADVSAAHGSPF